MVEYVHVNRYDSVMDSDESGTDTSTIELVRMAQQFRGEEPCFATDKRHDCAENCGWRRDCRKRVAVWLRH